MQFKRTTAKEIEKIITPLKTNAQKNMMKHQQKFLNEVHHLSALHLHTSAIDPWKLV